MNGVDELNAPTPGRHLSPLKILRGILCVLFIVTTAFFLLVYFAPVLVLLLRMFSMRLSRQCASFVFGLWLSLWPYLFERINGTKVVFSGESVPVKERALLFANHRTEVDWMFLWDLALRKGRIGYIKYILKSSLMKLPIFGWTFHIFEFVPVERKWELDEPVLRKKLAGFKDCRDPLWLAIFPEGTDYTEKKCTASKVYASKNGLPVLKHVLLPKIKGFHVCLQELRGSLDAVYDLTIAYKHCCPDFLDIILGMGPSEVHIHTTRIPLHSIPSLEDEASVWLLERFRIKDELLTGFCDHGCFPGPLVVEQGLTALGGAARCAAVTATTIALVQLTFSPSWAPRIYVALSCAALSAATYFRLEPQPLQGMFARGSTNKKRQ